jgi:hypothetical protein
MNNSLNVQFLQAPRLKFTNKNQLIYLMENKPPAFIIGIYLVIQLSKRSSHPLFCYIYFDVQKGQIVSFAISEGITNISSFELFIDNTKCC